VEVQCHTDESAATHCRTLLKWNRPQLAGPHTAAGALDEDGENLVRAMRQAGLVCVLKIGGRVAAGAICLRSGSDWQLHRLAHDPRFQAYGLGMLCCYFTACELIDRQRNKPAATTGRPRATHELAASRTRITVLTLHRPHASWLVRCDHALYATSMDYWQRTLQVRDDCLQLGHSLVRLVSAWRVAARMMKKRLASCWRYSALPAFLRSH